MINKPWAYDVFYWFASKKRTALRLQFELLWSSGVRSASRRFLNLGLSWGLGRSMRQGFNGNLPHQNRHAVIEASKRKLIFFSFGQQPFLERQEIPAAQPHGLWVNRPNPCRSLQFFGWWSERWSSTHDWYLPTSVMLKWNCNWVEQLSIFHR